MIERYLYKSERTLADVLFRVAEASPLKPHEKRMITEGYFLPSSPVLMFLGTELKRVTYASCFALNVKDDLDDIFDAARKIALITKYGGGVGIYLGNIRPRGAPLSEGGKASGVVSWLRVYNEVGDSVAQGGRRRGAYLALLPLTHEDARDFILSKYDSDLRPKNVLTNFNLSIAIESFDDFDNDLFDLACQLAMHGEPGFIFWEHVQAFNKTPDDPLLVNPCGEANIRHHEACLLGSVNLSKMVNNGYVDEQLLADAISVGVKFMNFILDRGVFPFPEYQFMQEINNKCAEHRRIGLGVMGYADMLLRLGVEYTDYEFADYFFSNFSRMAFSAMVANGFDNEALTAIAPTGSLSYLMECSSGIEPHFFIRSAKKTSNGCLILRNRTIDELGITETNRPMHFKLAHEIDPIDHINVLASIQRHIHQGVSKTINLPPDYNGDLRELVIYAHTLGLKGITFYKDGSRGNCIECLQ